MSTLIDQIFSKLSEHFPRDPSPDNAGVPERPLRALRLITRLRTTTVSTKSYELFETIMQSTVMEATKMGAARLALYPSYRRKLDLAVRDPEHIRNLLHYYDDLRTKRRGHATSVMPATGPVGNASGLLHQLPDREELGWWGRLCSGLGSSAGPPTS